MERLPLIICIGWGMGTFGISSMFNSVNLLLQRFATDFLGIAAAAYGLIYLVSKIYDAATDPVMGALSDRTRSRFGRRRPYLLLGGALCAAAFIALFNAPSVVDSPHALLLLALLLIFYSTGYTVFNVPYLAMPAEMTRDYMERARLISFRVYAIGFDKKGAAPFFAHLARLLRTRHGVAQMVLRVKGSFSAPAERAIMDEAAQWSAAVAGVGD